MDCSGKVEKDGEKLEMGPEFGPRVRVGILLKMLLFFWVDQPRNPRLLIRDSVLRK